MPACYFNGKFSRDFAVLFDFTGKIRARSGLFFILMTFSYLYF
jgi:hypothetical protein